MNPWFLALYNMAAYLIGSGIGAWVAWGYAKRRIDAAYELGADDLRNRLVYLIHKAADDSEQTAKRTDDEDNDFERKVLDVLTYQHRAESFREIAITLEDREEECLAE